LSSKLHEAFDLGAVTNAARGHVGSSPRGHFIDRTEAGRATYEAVVPLAQGFEAELTRELSDQQRTVLAQALSKLNAFVEEATDGLTRSRS
jgi:hypothetical protein